ncbi:MAG: polysaccharide deacetylase family protein [Gemmatimonadota bacterium]|nr:polysaccharide deacetylase family protein [Gemmatimonadota bacterium]
MSRRTPVLAAGICVGLLAVAWVAATPARSASGGSALYARSGGSLTGGGAERRIVLTYDDLPANIFRDSERAVAGITHDLVDAVNRHGIPAIGFVNESKLYPDGDLDSARVAFLQYWVAAGLELGNHSFSHPDLHSTDVAAFEMDVLAGERVTRELLAAVGRSPRYFRHPFLHTGRSLEIKSRVEAFLDDHGYRVAPVTIDNHEWIYARAYDHALVREDPPLAGRIAEAYVAYMDSVVGYYEAQSRALVGREIPQVLLLHANRLNADTTDELVGVLVDRGYSFIDLDEALRDPAYGLPDEFVGSGGITWIHRWALTRGERGEFFAGEPPAHPFVEEVFGNPPP